MDDSKPDSVGVGSVDKRETLFVIIDINPDWWALNRVSIDLITYLESILAFCNAHLVLSPLNDISIIGVNYNKAFFLYPPPPDDSVNPGNSSGFSVSGKYELLEDMNEIVRDRVRRVISSKSASSTTISVSSAITKALCYYNRLNKDVQSQKERQNARILIVKGADDDPHQYMSLMNSVFTAQKFQIPIDTCIIGKDIDKSATSQNADEENGHFGSATQFKQNVWASGLLQQAAELTSGIYLHIPEPSALLQYLLCIFLPRVELRSIFNLPCGKSAANNRQSSVDFRAACFCHRKLVDIGYVCSVCLSIFCVFSPICSTCYAQFKLQTTTPKK